MRSVAIAGLGLAAAACGRLSFDPQGTRDASAANDAAIGPSDIGIDAPSQFGDFTALGRGQTIAKIAPDEQLVIAGTINSVADFGGGPLPYAGGNDAYIASFTVNGEFLWARTIGSASDELANSVAVDPQGNVYVGGQFMSTVDFGGGPVVADGGNDAYVASYTRDGQYRWARKIGSASGAATDSTLALAADANGVYASGLSLGTMNAGGTPVSCTASNQEAFLAAYASDGTHRWSKCFGSGAFNNGRALATDAAGNVYMSGYFTTSINFGGGSITGGPGLDVFLVSFTSAGVQNWAQGFNGPGDEWGQGLASDAAGNVVVTGFFTGTTDFNGAMQTSSGSNDAFVAAYTNTGAYRWSHRWGSSSCDQARLAYIENGEVYVAGYYEGTTNFGGGSVTSTLGDGVVVHYRQDGSYIDSILIGGPMVDLAFAALPTRFGTIVVGRADSNDSLCPNSGPLPAGQVYMRRY